MKNANPVSFYLRLPVLSLVFCLVACAREAAREQPVASKQEQVKTFAEYFEVRLGSATARLQVALSAAEQQQGLMHRRELGPEEGMIFVYKRPQRLSFWMRNTPTALDIGFFDREGILREIYPLFPFDETPVQSRRQDLLYAVEMPLGWFRAKGVKIGDKLDLAAVLKAVKARGQS